MSIFHPHFRDPIDFMPADVLVWWSANAKECVRLLTHPAYRHAAANSKLSENLFIYVPKHLIMENEMNGRKSKTNGTKLESSSSEPVSFRWINVTLSDQDLDILERETASLELVASSLVQLVVRGLGISVKYDPVGKSYSCSIYGRDTRNNMQPCGISGRASDVRDAILVSLYRFETGLQGSFDGQSDQGNVLQSKRFR